MPIEATARHWQVSLLVIEHLGGKASIKQIEDYFKSNFPDRNINNIRPDVTMLSVNANSRVHYFGGKQLRRTDTGSIYDKLFRRADRGYELYDPAIHGVWEIAKEDDGTLVVRQVTDAISVESVESSSQIVAPDDAIYAPEGAGGRFALESHLRDYLAGDNAYYVMELKLGRGPDAALGQTLRYMGWVKQHLADDKPVYGVVIAAEISDKLRYATSMTQGVFLMQYDLKVFLRPAKKLGE